MAVTDAYLGNPNLKKINIPQEFTKEQILEYQKCAADPIYFMETYVKIVSLDEGLIPFKLYDGSSSHLKYTQPSSFPYSPLSHTT